jgi:Domain of unknown function (DUF4304)
MEAVMRSELHDALKNLVDHWLTPPLKAIGFRKASQRFTRDAGDCLLLIDVQRSVSSTKDVVRFTINLGIQSKSILAFFGARAAAFPSLDDCHWRVRIHQLAPSEVPEWATIDHQTDLDSLGRGLRMWIQMYAIPALEQYGYDAALTELWMSGDGPGLTRFQRLMNVAVLLKNAGTTSELESVLSDLDKLAAGKPFAARVEDLRVRVR